MLAVLMLAMAQPAKIEVVNLCPPKIEVVNLCPPARSVPVTTFRNELPYNPTHRCQQCGSSQFVISGWLPNGQHIHTDANGHSWRH